MLEMQILRDQKERVITGFMKRGFSPERLELVDKAIKLDEERKDVQTQFDSLLNERNTLSEEIGNLFKKGKGAEANELKAKVQVIKDNADAMELRLMSIKSDLEAI